MVKGVTTGVNNFADGVTQMINQEGKQQSRAQDEEPIREEPK